MEEKQGKGNQVLLIVLGIATLLVAVVGATFAYFSASSVSGNVDANNINATTAQYGNTWVTYAEGSSTINIDTLDLPKTEAGTDYQWLMKFTVSTTSTAAQDIKVNWSNIENNTFCAYQVGGTGVKCSESETGHCTNGPTIIETAKDTDACTLAGGTWTTSTNTSRLDEFTYELYSCTDEAAYNGTTADAEAKTVTLNANCTPITNSGEALSTAMPRIAATNTVHGADKLPIAASADGATPVVNYYALVVQIKNREDDTTDDGTGIQDYNQARAFRGAFEVSVVAR